MMIMCLLLNASARKAINADSTGRGIDFLQGLRWAKILKKAKLENKYIFVDCYASWCGPCKRMDSEVYNQAEVGDIYNNKFVCIKMQMDTTNKDRDTIRRAYADAAFIRIKYAIGAYPTFLYFTPDGNLLRKDIGALRADAFLNLTADVLNPENNYYTLLAKYKAGKMEMTGMPTIARTALMLGDTIQAERIADDYMHRLKAGATLTEDDIRLRQLFTRSSQDIGFDFFYRFSDSIDKVMKSDTYAEDFVEQIISKEMIGPAIAHNKTTDSEPDWASIQDRIKSKYNADYAERSVITARIGWAATHHNWDDWSKYFTSYVDKYGTKLTTGTWVAFDLNNDAWSVFTYSNSTPALRDALSWSARAVLIDPQPSWMDTYANILYKLGDVTSALAWETIANKIAIKGDPDTKLFEASLAKMKAGEATWPSQ